MNAYNEDYLLDAMRNLGEAFDYAINACGMSAEVFVKLFAGSRMALSFGNGNPKYIAGMSGTELVMDIIDASGLSFEFPKPQVDYGCSPEYWAGWALAYYQWKIAKSFRFIFENISFQQVLALYPTLHEASEDKFVDVVESIINKQRRISRLQQYRKLCGYSQSELAQKSGVNLRTLQQYELGTKSLEKASYATVISLARVLGCDAEEII